MRLASRRSYVHSHTSSHFSKRLQFSVCKPIRAYRFVYSAFSSGGDTSKLRLEVLVRVCPDFASESFTHEMSTFDDEFKRRGFSLMDSYQSPSGAEDAQQLTTNVSKHIQEIQRNGERI